MSLTPELAEFDLFFWLSRQFVQMPNQWGPRWQQKALYVGNGQILFQRFFRQTCQFVQVWTWRICFGEREYMATQNSVTGSDSHINHHSLLKRHWCSLDTEIITQRTPANCTVQINTFIYQGRLLVWSTTYCWSETAWVMETVKEHVSLLDNMRQMIYFRTWWISEQKRIFNRDGRVDLKTDASDEWWWHIKNDP